MTTMASSELDPATREPGKPWLVAAMLLTVAVGLLLLWLPLGTMASQEGVATPVPGNSSAGPTREEPPSLLAAEGSGVVAVLGVPVVLCAAPLLCGARRRRQVAFGAALVLAAGVVVSVSSIGVAYLPSLVLLLIGAARTRPS